MTTAPADAEPAHLGDRSAAPGVDGLRHSPWLILFSLCLGFFMILLDTTIVNIAIPDMSAKLDATLDEILWVLNAYVLVYAVLLITAGRLGDLYGPKQLFLGGLVIFTLASVACGFAQNPTQLILARIAQGVGGALLTPQTLSVITMIFPPEKRGAAFGIWGVATVAGPTLGGLIVTDWGWRWIFMVNLPVGILTLVLAAIVMPNLRLNRHHKLDLVGTALVTAGLFLLTYGLIEGQPHNWGRVWGPITIPMVIALGAIVLAIFGWHQYAQRDAEPLIPLAIFRDRNFSVMNFVGGAVGFTMLGLFLPLVIFLQSVLGLTALDSGLTIAPMSLVAMFVAPVAGRMSDRIGGKYILTAGLTLFATGMGLVLASANVGSTRLSLLPGLIIAGFGLGMTFAPLQTVAMRDIQPRMAGAASGLINTSRQVGSVIGSAAVGALLQHELARSLTKAATRNAPTLPESMRQPFIAEFRASATGALQIGSQTGVKAPPGLPQQAVQQLTRVATLTFHQGFTSAMRASLILPIVVLAIAALSCLLIKGRRHAASSAEPPDRTSAGPAPGSPASPASAAGSRA